MTGRRYYITALADWHRHAHRFANSHWLALDDDAVLAHAADSDAHGSAVDTVGARPAGAAKHIEDVPEPADGTAAPSSRELPDASCAVGNELACAGHDVATNGTVVPSSFAGHGDAVPLLNAIDADAIVDPTARILVLIDADEGVHLALEDDATFEALPHPFAPKSISDAAQQALAPHGVAPGATTFDAAEAAARAHPLLRPRVF